MENERLLSEQEIVKIWDTRQEGHYTCGDCRDLLIAAQDAKTTAARDKWFIEWVENTIRTCDNHDCYKHYDGCHIGFAHCVNCQALKQSILEVKK